jgi:hypoxanthine phosphoribosyltransferase
MARRFLCEVVSWGEVTRLVRRLALAITAAGYRPDVIVAIARGGYVPARLLADYLNVMVLASFKIEHYAPGARKQRRARIAQPLNIAVAGKCVLVVDDVADSGDTFVAALRHIKKGRPAAIKTAALHYKTTSRVRPDFIGEQTLVWRWINYPWARIEDINGFIQRMKPRPASAAAAAQRLQREFGMRVPRALVADAMRFADG